jgi:predicted molibdopterin-dependent oxidoreductase YjgC
MEALDLEDVFEPYDRLINVLLCGNEYQLPENNTILRGLQFLDREEISYGDFCWNGECLNCQVWIRNGEKEKNVMACRTNVADGMEITRLSETLDSAMETTTAANTSAPSGPPHSTTP